MDERELRREIADVLPPCSLEWFDALASRMHGAEDALDSALRMLGIAVDRLERYDFCPTPYDCPHAGEDYPCEDCIADYLGDVSSKD